MKLLYCVNCGDVFNLSLQEKTCSCGEVKGKYEKDRLNATYSGNAIPIGFANYSFSRAIREISDTALAGKEFIAFVIPANCLTFRKEDK